MSNNSPLKNTLAAITAAALVLVLALPCAASDDAKRKDIEKMLELTGATASLPDLIRPNIDGIVSKLRHKHPDMSEEATAAVEEEIQKIFNDLMNTTMAIFVGMYDRNFTHEEIKELIAIYESPVWRKQVALQGKMYRQMTEEMQRSGAPIMAKGLERIRERLHEHGIEF
ncbi:DUF2059 domain-containing protein [Salidesulfovibrio brasiliensis]|uniref:DUF2059 domain-containing protein n=1 Tax=Salidesulfovibrio brasiliensis TaxID=221711 RepID=UPI0006D0C38D|nr:DUF2059 domain-containing protein [Salidesulfovibrio brasiliensis]